MAINKTYQFELDFLNPNSIFLPNVVSGDTGNTFVITVKNGGATVNLTGARIRFIITNKDGVGSQDTAVTGNDIDMTNAASGVLSISVHADMISNALNTGVIEVYTDGGATLSTTNAFNFIATLSPSEKAAEYPSLIKAEQDAAAALEAALTAIDNISSIVSAYIDDNGHLILVKDTGTEIDAGYIGFILDCVQYISQTKTDAQKSVARTNIGAAAAVHAHGNITGDGKITGKALKLVETDSNGAVVANRSLKVVQSDPSQMSGLTEGDVLLWEHTDPPAHTDSEIVDLIYPVGSIYMSVNSTSPATLFGGTWQQISDTFLLAAGSTYTAGSTGGEATHTLTVDEIPSHTHVEQVVCTAGVRTWASAGSSSGSNKYFNLQENLTVSPNDNEEQVVKTLPTGGGNAHNNMPPYLAVYVWKRTA